MVKPYSPGDGSDLVEGVTAILRSLHEDLYRVVSEYAGVHNAIRDVLAESRSSVMDEARRSVLLDARLRLQLRSGSGKLRLTHTELLGDLREGPAWDLLEIVHAFAQETAERAVSPDEHPDDADDDRADLSRLHAVLVRCCDLVAQAKAKAG